MTNSSREDLLGYMLGALDATETQEIENQIQQNTELQKELEELELMVAPLENLETPPAPSVGLARRTIEYVAGKSRSTTMTPSVDLSSEARGWSLTDFLVGALTIAILAAIAIPTINYARFNSRITHCKDNLRQVGNALFLYQEISEDGSYVPIPTSPQDKLNVAGAYAPILLDSGLVDRDEVFYCDQYRGPIPTTRQIQNACGPRLAEYRRNMGGDYGYNLGYYDGDRYCVPRNRRRCNFAVLSDRPDPSAPGRASQNHNGVGQVVWFEDGSIRFMKETVTPCGDYIFENESGECGPGVCCSDACIGQSSASPIKPRRCPTAE